MKIFQISALLLVCLLIVAGISSAQQVSYQDIVNAQNTPQNWLTFSGTYGGLRYSTLGQITPANAKNLEIKWVYQMDSVQKMESTPLVVNGVMYVTQPPDDILALDAKRGTVFWTYHYPLPADARLCCGNVNRGLAISGNTLYLGTGDSHVIAVDAKDGKQLWDVQVADNHAGYGITEAPLVVKDKVIVGMAGAEFGIRGFIIALSATTGEELWKFYTVPGPGEPGSETWPKDTAWQHGGGSSWVTGTYDPDLNLVFWGTGNPWPGYDYQLRLGDNLYTDSAIALDADTGKLKWHFQFTPNDRADYDAIQVPVLADIDWQGARQKVVLWANRNGFFYVLDRATGKFLRGAPFVKVTWATGLDANGRPIRSPQGEGTLAGNQVFPGTQGGTNWFSPSFSPRTGLFYVTAWQDYSAVFIQQPTANGRVRQMSPVSPLPNVTRGPLNTWTDAVGHGEVQAIDPATGDKKWVFKMDDVSDSGVLTTASDMLFTGNREGYFHVLDARTGKLLWRATTGGQMAATPITYEVDGKQFVAMGSGHALFVFGLRDQQ